MDRKVFAAPRGWRRSGRGREWTLPAPTSWRRSLSKPGRLGRGDGGSERWLYVSYKLESCAKRWFPERAGPKDPFSSIAPRSKPQGLDRGSTFESVVRPPVEEVIGCVRYAGNLPNKGSVRRGRFAAGCVHALDELCVG